MVPINNTTNSEPCVGNVPLVTGINFFAARLPAIASAGIMNTNLAISMSMPIEGLYQGVFALFPEKALPLFPAPLVYAYNISEKPCGPPLLVLAAAGPGGFQ